MATDYPKPDSLLCGPRGVGQPFDAILVFTASLTPASVAQAATAEQTATVNGVLATDYVNVVNQPARTNSVAVCEARASAANQVSITYVNPTAGALTPPAGTYTFLVFRPATNPSK
jgi:hypothetical protein